MMVYDIVRKKTGITKSTINAALYKMQVRGLIELRSGEKRNVRFFLSTKGEELKQRYRNNLKEKIERL